MLLKHFVYGKISGGSYGILIQSSNLLEPASHHRRIEMALGSCIKLAPFIELGNNINSNVIRFPEIIKFINGFCYYIRLYPSFNDGRGVNCLYHAFVFDSDDLSKINYQPWKLNANFVKEFGVTKVSGPDEKIWYTENDKGTKEIDINLDVTGRVAEAIELIEFNFKLEKLLFIKKINPGNLLDSISDPARLCYLFSVGVFFHFKKEYFEFIGQSVRIIFHPDDLTSDIIRNGKQIRDEYLLAINPEVTNEKNELPPPPPPPLPPPPPPQSWQNEEIILRRENEALKENSNNYEVKLKQLEKRNAELVNSRKPNYVLIAGGCFLILALGFWGGYKNRILIPVSQPEQVNLEEKVEQLLNDIQLKKDSINLLATNVKTLQETSKIPKDSIRSRYNELILKFNGSEAEYKKKENKIIKEFENKISALEKKNKADSININKDLSVLIQKIKNDSIIIGNHNLQVVNLNKLNKDLNDKVDSLIKLKKADVAQTPQSETPPNVLDTTKK